MKSDIIESRKIFVLMFKTPIKGNTEITNNKNKNKNKTELFSIQVGGGYWREGNGKFTATLVVFPTLVFSNVPALFISQRFQVATPFILVRLNFSDDVPNNIKFKIRDEKIAIVIEKF